MSLDIANIRRTGLQQRQPGHLNSLSQWLAQGSGGFNRMTLNRRVKA